MTETPVLTADSTEEHRSGRVYSSIVLAVIAAAGLAVAFNSYRLGLGTAGAPGAGLWPFAVGLVAAIAAGSAAVVAWRAGFALDPVDKLGKPLVGVGLTLLFVLLFSYVGFVVSMVVTLVLWQVLLTNLSWKRIAIATATITAILYLLFSVIVGTAFPPSIAV